MIERSKQVKSMFLEAIEEHAPEDWLAFLRQACGSDMALHDEVERLLRAQAELGTFREATRTSLLTMVEHPGTEHPGTEHPGTVIGPYKLLEQIGEGAMGVVYLAEQEKPVRRRVALKIIKPGMDTAWVIARFESERQALALMDHPNIAKVLDAGATSSGQPYFIMELVKGGPITDFCDEDKLPPEARLRLFLDVCHAIQHAHQKGIIHRDIKPTNVLVTLQDEEPLVKVIDFGIAKATGQKLTERTLFTACGQMIGTPEYMSPEQAETSSLDIDTRSDVYALGVLLYELLTGTTPLAGKRLSEAGYFELQRLIREEEAPRPSTRLSSLGDSATGLASRRGVDLKGLVRLLSGELDWIVMKALEKDRDRRYATTGTFAEDIERFLRREAILARPPSTVYRVKKFAQRHRAAVAMACAMVASLLIGSAVATWQAVVATHAQQDALTAAGAEKVAKELAQAREGEARMVLEFLETRVLAAARPKGQAGGMGREVTLGQAVAAALPFVEKSFTNQPIIEARLRMSLGQSFRYLGEAKTATDQCQKAIILYSNHMGSAHPVTLRSMHDLALCYHDLGRYTEALKLHDETLSMQRTKLGPDHPDTLRSMNCLACTYAALGRHADALRLKEQTLERMKAKLGPDHPDTLSTMHSLANSYAALCRRADALKLREETLALRSARLGPDHPDTLLSMYSLANSYTVLGRHADAVRLREATLALQKANLGFDHPDTFRSMNGLAASYANLGRHSDAVNLYQATLALQEAKLGPDHPDSFQTLYNLAISYAALGRHVEALELRERALALHKAKLGPEHPRTLMSMNNVASSYAALGRHADALMLYRETLALQTARLGPDHSDTQSSVWGVAHNLVKLGRGSEAVPVIDEYIRSAAGKLPWPRLLPSVLDLRLRHFEKSRDATGCRQTAAMWENQKGIDAGSLYNAARMRAVTAAVFQRADNSPAGFRQANLEAERAMDWLKQAVASGYKDAAHMKQDKDLDALRDRPDFVKLMAVLQTPPPAKMPAPDHAREEAHNR
jgi:non-specific serine/threonine protein kinase/serine/threonine-protein kinase